MKINKTFKKSISILLTVIMILSTFGAAIVPVGAAATTENTSSAATYYLWYSTGNDSNIGGWTKKVTMTATGTNSYYYDLTVNTGGNFYFTINTSSTPASTPWSDGSDVTSNVTYDSGVKTSFSSSQEHSGCYFPIFSLQQNQTLRFTFTPTKKVVVSVAGSTEETTAPTTPSSSTWYINGRFGVKDGSFVDWANGAKTDFILTDGDNDGIYTINTGYTEKELSDNHTTAQWWIKLFDGNKIYGPNGGDSSGDAQLSLKTENSTLPSTATLMQKDSGSWYISGTSTSGNVILCLDTNTNQFYYTIDSGDVSDTPGAYTIDGVVTNGALSFKADGKTSGTANAGDTVNITLNPAASYTLDTLQAVDANGNEITITDNKFTMPASNVTVTATFVFDKVAYIATQGDGLWFDAAPSVTDTSATLVKWNNYTGGSHNTRSSYVLYIPKDVNLSAVTLYNGYDSALTINGTTIPANGSAVANLSETTYTTSGATSKSVEVMQGSSASIFFYTTLEGKEYALPTAVSSVDTRVNPEKKGSIEADGGVCITIDGSDISEKMKLSSVKGRGNSSWKASGQIFGKYAYNMKLKDNTNLLGILESGEKAKSYCLLANNADESMLRNALTYDLAKNVGLYNSPEFKFVDMYDNGEYHGTYFICEKVDVGEKKLIKGVSFDDINEEKLGKDVIEAGKATGDTYTYGNLSYSMQYLKTGDNNTTTVPYDTEGTYLLEFEIYPRYESETAWFETPKGQHVVVKSPEDATKEQVQYIAEKFAAMEAAAYASNASVASLDAHMDVDSFAKMYLIQELSSNLDAASTSYYITVDCSNNIADENGVLVTDNAKFVASPVWDYDWAYGQYEKGLKKDINNNPLDPDNPEVWFAKNKSIGASESGGNYSLQSKLANNINFQSVIKKVWNGTSDTSGDGFYDVLKNYFGTDSQIDTWKAAITDSMAMNEYRWGFIASDKLNGAQSNNDWGSKDTGDTLDATVQYLEDWIKNRSAWLNDDEQIQGWKNYTQIATPTLTAYTADGETELTGDVTQGAEIVLKATTTETYVTYRLYDNNEVIANNDTGVFNVPLTTTGVHNFIVKTIYNGTESEASNIVAVNVLPTGPVEVPNVVGMEEADAKTALENSGFKVIVTTENSETVTAGLVISSDPEGGTTATYGSDVTIVVSTGPVVENPTVPNVVGMLENDAIAELTALGYKVEVTTTSSDTVESGYVISTDPIFGTSLAAGSTVTIVVSTGPVPKETINNVTIMFKSTNIKSLTPEFYFNDKKQTDFARVSRENSGYIGTYYTGAYAFYWWSVELDEVVVGDENIIRFKTTGSDMDATLTYDFAGCTSGSTLYFAVNNMYNGTEVENITDSDAKKYTFRSAVNMISTKDYAGDPTLPKVSQAFLAAAGIATNKALTVGDTNADGDINIKDATAAQMMSAGYVQPTVASSVLGDFDLSGDVNIKDATDIQTHVVYN